MQGKIAKPEHEVAYQDLCVLLRKHADAMTPMELLAVAANMLGKMIALQKQELLDNGSVDSTVRANVEHGIRQVVTPESPVAGSA